MCNLSKDVTEVKGQFRVSVFIISYHFQFLTENKACRYNFYDFFSPDILFSPESDIDRYKETHTQTFIHEISLSTNCCLSAYQCVYVLAVNSNKAKISVLHTDLSFSLSCLLSPILAIKTSDAKSPCQTQKLIVVVDRLLCCSFVSLDCSLSLTLPASAL